MKKLDSKSLMIGDWVNIYVFPNESPKEKDLFPAIITTILTPLPNEQGGEHIECIFKSENGGIGSAARPVNTCLPIPLTPEILEKNGFKARGYEELVLEADEYCFALQKGVDGINAWWWEMFSSPIIPINHVHELQHCLKMVGIDKEIVL